MSLALDEALRSARQSTAPAFIVDRHRIEARRASKRPILIEPSCLLFRQVCCRGEEGAGAPRANYNGAEPSGA